MTVKFNAERYRQNKAYRVADKLSGEDRQTIGRGVISDARWEMRTSKMGGDYAALVFRFAGVERQALAASPKFARVTDGGILTRADSDRPLSLWPVSPAGRLLATLGVPLDGAISTYAKLIDGVTCTLFRKTERDGRPARSVSLLLAEDVEWPE